MADGAMPSKPKRKAQTKPSDGKKPKKSVVPAERAALEPAPGRLGEIFSAMRSSSDIRDAMKTVSFDSVLAALGRHCFAFGISGALALPLPKHIRVLTTDDSDVSNGGRCIHREHGFFLGASVAQAMLPAFLEELVRRAPDLGKVGTWHCELWRTVPTA
jgi:hypothetical protein